MTPENRQLNSAEEIIRAQECLRQAREAFTKGEHEHAVSRAYYAVFHMARAALFAIGHQSKSHRGLIFLFDHHLVVPGLVDPKYAAILGRLHAYRGYSDYGPYDVITPEVARRVVADAESFCHELAPWIEDRVHPKQ